MEIKLSKEGLTKTGVILLLLSGLVFHDFFALKYVKLGVITITYLRVILVVTIPLLLFLYKVRIRKNDVLAYVLLIFMAYGLTRIGENFKEAFAIYCPLVAFFFLYFSIDNKKTMMMCIDLMSLLFMFFCIVGLVELISNQHFVETRLMDLEETKRVACGMYYNENDFSAFLSVSLIYMLLSRNKKITKVIFVLIAILIVIINNSIICLLGIIMLFLVFFILKKRVNRIFRFGLVLVLILSASKPANDIIKNSSIWWRSYMYSLGIKNVMKHMWFGTGIGKYEAGMLELGFDAKKYYVASANPHNLFYELAGVFGIIWAIMLIVFLLKLALWYLKMPKNKENIYSLVLVIIVPFVGLSSSSCMEKNYIYMALLIPLIQYRLYKNRFNTDCVISSENDFPLSSEACSV